jgi:hypothetical protein
MVDIEAWRAHAKTHNGNIVVWINQSDPGSSVREANSDGVCYAITMDWIDSYRRYLSDRSLFVNSFREYDDHGKLLSYVIPQLYLDNQDEYRKQRELNNTEYKKLFADYETAKAEYGKSKTSTAKAAMDAAEAKAKMFRRRAYGGPNCIRYTMIASLENANTILSGITVPGYYAFAFHRDGGGHVVGFEFRPDQSTLSFKGIYEFIDANTGLLVFGTVDMVAFAKAYVWPMYTKYTSYSLLQYGIGLGGFGKDPDIDALEAELENLK